MRPRSLVLSQFLEAIFDDTVLIPAHLDFVSISSHSFAQNLLSNVSDRHKFHNKITFEWFYKPIGTPLEPGEISPALFQLFGKVRHMTRLPNGLWILTTKETIVK